MLQSLHTIRRTTPTSLAVMALTVASAFIPSSSEARPTRPPNPPELKEFHVTARLPETNHTCETEAGLWARRFARATGLAVTSQQCRAVVELRDGGKVYRLNSVALTYLAAKEVHPYSAIFGTPDHWGTPSLGRGIFDSYGDCVAQIEEQSLSFETHTSLPLVTGSCIPSQYTLEPTYSLQLDGYGTPKKKLRAFKTSFRGTVSPAMQAELQDLYVNFGGDIAFQTGELTHYYSDQNNLIHYDFLHSFENADHCIMQLAEARGIFEKMGSRKVVLGCLPQNVGNGKIRWMMEGMRDRSALERVALPWATPYYSFEECLSDRARAIAESLSRSEHPVGALCTQDWSGKVSMNVYKRISSP